jgi:hypothetical protein
MQELSRKLSENWSTAGLTFFSHLMQFSPLDWSCAIHASKILFRGFSPRPNHSHKHVTFRAKDLQRFNDLLFIFNSLDLLPESESNSERGTSEVAPANFSTAIYWTPHDRQFVAQSAGYVIFDEEWVFNRAAYCLVVFMPTAFMITSPLSIL